VIFRICESIQVLNFGKTMAFGAPEEIRTDRQVIAAYLGEEGAREIEEQRAED
jgi:ABC-type branched-subunit amino acid transport system ATPase component